jgi:hypothetical protein
MYVLQFELDEKGQERIFLAKPILKSDDCLIILANDRMLDWAREFLHDRVLVMDKTFGLNHLGYSVLAMLVLDESGGGLPVTFAIMKSEKSSSFEAVLRAFDAAVNAGRAASEYLKPAAVLFDNSDAEQLGARYRTAGSTDAVLLNIQNRSHNTRFLV